MASHAHIPTATQDLPPVVSEMLFSPFKRFAMLSSAGGLVLLACTVIALLWSNASAELHHSYHALFHEFKIRFYVGDMAGLSWSLGHWINDGLMAFFFLLVGLEIKREIVAGELASPKKAALPIVAALGGMAVPAILYTLVNTTGIAGLFGGGGVSHGWGIPMATDIAFALGIMALLGSRVPASLKVFLTSLAIADDLGALLVIAIFYTENLAWSYLGLSAAIVGLLVAINILQIRNPIAYLLPGVLLWYFVYMSGVHATIAGVLLAATIPATARVNTSNYLQSSRKALEAFENAARPGTDVKTNPRQRAAVMAMETNNKLVLPPLIRMEHAIHPWAAFFIIPIFALANAGVYVGDQGLGSALSGPVSMGVIIGLLFGKPIGIVLACWLAVKTGIAGLPKGVTWQHIIGCGFLAGIGFTMAIFIANLAFPNDAEGIINKQHAIIGILAASTLASIVGLIILGTAPKQAGADHQSLDMEPVDGPHHGPHHSSGH